MIGDNNQGRANFSCGGRERTHIGIGRRSIANWRAQHPMPMCASDFVVIAQHYRTLAKAEERSAEQEDARRLSTDRLH
jgi:hypothetical protein